MKRIFILLLIINISLINYGQIIADHSVVDKYDRIPQQYINEVKKMLVDIAGESHSSGYRIGMNLLELLNPAYQVTTFNGTIPYYSASYVRFGGHGSVGEEDFYTTQTAINAYKTVITNQNSTVNPYSVMGFGWCWDMTWTNAPGGTKDPVYNVHWAGSSEGGPNGNLIWGLDIGDQALTGNIVSMDTYINAVEQYIQLCTTNNYSTKIIFTTGPVDNQDQNVAGTENGFQREIKHDYIRNYVAAGNSRILFDYADILCWNNSGVKYVTNWNDGGTLRPHANIHPDNMSDYDASWNIITHTEDGDHIGEVGALRLAKAMWWLLARIAGWDGGYTWQGGISNNFAKPTNWKESAVPPDGSNITFASDVSNPCILDRDRTLGNINISQAAYGFSVDGKQLTITGNLNLSGGAQIDATVPGSVVVFAGSEGQSIPSGAFSGNTVDNVIINNPAGLSVNGNLTISGLLTINSGNLLSVSPATSLTVSGNLSNNGTLNLNSDATGIFSLMMNSYSGSGTANINMYLTGGWGGGEVQDYKWHYVAVPADYINDKSVFISVDANNLLKYDDAIIPDDFNHTSFDGWIWHDGWTIGTTGPPPYNGPKFSDLKVRTGYNFYHSNTSAEVSFRNLSSLQTMLGIIPLQYSGDGKKNPSNYGYNLLGNSLTCGIDWNLVTNETGNPADVVYFTINNKLGAYLNGAPDGINGATKNIPPLQGFFVKTSSSGTSLNFSAAREHTIQPRYKKGSISDIPFIKLELNKSGNQDETLIWFNDKATNLFDSNYDAIKLFLSANGYDQIYTCFGTTKYGINGIHFPAETIIIPLGVKVNAHRSDYTIIASQITGLDNYKVTLSDKLNSNFTVDLKKTDRYSFSSESGTFEDRFYLTITNDLRDLPSVTEAQKAFNIFVFENVLNIEVLNSEWEGNPCTIDIFDLAGKKVLWESNIKCYTGDLKQIPLNISDGIYIVRIKEKARVWVSKIPVF